MADKNENLWLISSKYIEFTNLFMALPFLRLQYQNKCMEAINYSVLARDHKNNGRKVVIGEPWQN